MWSYSISYLGLSRTGFFLRFRFGDRKEILRDRLEEFERPFSIDLISGHYILKDRWRNLRDRFGPSKHLKKTLVTQSAVSSLLLGSFVRTLYFLLKNSIASEMTHMFDLRKQRHSAGSAVVELALLQISYCI